MKNENTLSPAPRLQPATLSKRAPRPPAASTKIASDGSYQVTPPQTGLYHLCVIPTGDWIGSCDWGTTGQNAFVWSNDAVVLSNIVLRRAGTLTILLKDTQNSLGQYEGKSRNAHLMVGITHADLTFHRAATAGHDSQSRTYSLLVPLNDQHHLTAVSNFFQITAPGGNVSNSTFTVPVSIPGDVAPAVALTQTIAMTLAGHR